MLTKEDFSKAILQTAQNYPHIMHRIEAYDPLILQNLEANSQMLAMLSAQIELSCAEVFNPVKKSTILASCAMRGIIPKSAPCKVKIAITSTQNISLDEGLELIDDKGNIWQLSSAVNCLAHEPNYAYIEQKNTIKVVHLVKEKTAFYPIKIDLEHESLGYLADLNVISGSLGELKYSADFLNVGAEDKVFTLEFDENGYAFIRFGQKNIKNNF